MFPIKKNNKKGLSILLLISFICFANARQIRYSRFKTEVIEDNVGNQTSNISTEEPAEVDVAEVEATVREIKLAPYPASGFKPSKPFLLPNEAAARNMRNDLEEQVTDESVIAAETDTINFTTTTQGYESETTTINTTENDDNSFNSDDQQKKDTNLTDTLTELSSAAKAKASYPAAGYRPSISFLLPSEQLQLQDESRRDAKPTSDNSKHPVCGSSTHPLAPKPPNDQIADPDSESVDINAKTQKGSQPFRTVIPVRLTIHPLMLRRPLVYSAPTLSF